MTTLSHANKLLEGWEGGLPCSLTSLPTHNPLQSHVEAAILRDKEAGRSLKIMMKMGPMTKINGTCQGPSSGGVDVAPLKAVEPHPFLPPALPRRPREARWRTRKVASTSACSTKRGRCGAQGGVGFECGHVDQGWPDLGIELPPLAPASRRPTPDLACARGEGLGSAGQKGGRGRGLGSHEDDDRARWGRRKQGWRITRTRTNQVGRR